MLICVFVAMWLMSVKLFRKAAQSEAGAGNARRLIRCSYRFRIFTSDSVAKSSISSE